MKKENPTKIKKKFKENRRYNTAEKKKIQCSLIPTEKYTYSQDKEQTFTRKKIILPRHDRIKQTAKIGETSSLSLKKAKH